MNLIWQRFPVQNNILLPKVGESKSDNNRAHKLMNETYCLVDTSITDANRK